jgi:hypothetical protein
MQCPYQSVAKLQLTSPVLCWQDVFDTTANALWGISIP